jgi:ribonucleoside-diphosphate reductase alpha chain
MGHLKKMAAVQPFNSGAKSKTINMPSESTVEDVKDVYVQSWKLGLKALALYRDGSKSSQPLNTKREEEKEDKATEPVVVYKPRRRRLNDERQAITHKFSIAGHEGYITVGLYEDGQPGEIFITMAKQGSVISGLMDAFATSISISLQYGVPVSTVVRKFANSRFEPYGFTANPQIRIAKSIVDYIARFLALKFLSPSELSDIGIKPDSQATSSQAPLELEVAGPGQAVPIKVEENRDTDEGDIAEPQPMAATDAPPCPTCGSMTTKTGTCYTCLSCGSTTGGCS